MQKMTRDGAVNENKATGTTERISERDAAPVFTKPQETATPQPEQPLKPPLPISQDGGKPDTGIAERVIGRADTEHKRRSCFVLQTLSKEFYLPHHL